MPPTKQMLMYEMKSKVSDGSGCAGVINMSLFCAAGCTFDEDSDLGPCQNHQGLEDDFDWQLVRTHTWPRPLPGLPQGKSENRFIL